MDQQPNMGSFGMGMGQDPLQEAIAARQGGAAPVPAPNQTMQGSPQPVPTSGQEAPMPQNGQGSNEAQMIIEALSKRLSTIGKSGQGAPNTGGGGDGTRPAMGMQNPIEGPRPMTVR